MFNPFFFPFVPPQPAPVPPTDLFDVVEALQNHVEALQNALYVPWAKRMADEYYAKQDLDGDGVIYGHDFFFSGLNFELYPPVLMPVQRAVTKQIEEGAGWCGLIVPIRSYYAHVVDPRDRAAIRRIFEIEDHEQHTD